MNTQQNDAPAKEWYRSETIRGGVLSLLTGVVLIAFAAAPLLGGNGVDVNLLQEGVLALAGAASSLGGLLSVHGRVKATRPIAPLGR